ncbi:uncharacterized protein LOC103099513 [Monodelphis domestica]|uniref:uncharacterized protein LOC103099513 n=1 Tax=Monodelphis domestica TaxID=13616 RepID=UPI0024E19A52|nr:uncharacterized protein LOC103099513 [Monodelphis domestica]
MEIGVGKVVTTHKPQTAASSPIRKKGSLLIPTEQRLSFLRAANGCLRGERGPEICPKAILRIGWQKSGQNTQATDCCILSHKKERIPAHPYGTTAFSILRAANGCLRGERGPEICPKAILRIGWQKSGQNTQATDCCILSHKKERIPAHPYGTTAFSILRAANGCLRGERGPEICPKATLRIGWQKSGHNTQATDCCIQSQKKERTPAHPYRTTAFSILRAANGCLRGKRGPEICPKPILRIGWQKSGHNTQATDCCIQSNKKERIPAHPYRTTAFLSEGC